MASTCIAIEWRAASAKPVGSLVRAASHSSNEYSSGR